MTSYDGARAIVIGGSISGLTTGLLLRDLGFSVTIFERTPTVLDGRGSGIVLQPDTLRWFTERSSQNPADLTTSTQWVQYLDAADTVIHREQRTWSYTSWGTFYRALLNDFGLQRYRLGEYACGSTRTRTASPSGSSAGAKRPPSSWCSPTASPRSAGNGSTQRRN